MMLYTRPYPPPEGADVGLNLTRTSTVPSPCDCQDADLEKLVDLIASGVDQWTASRLLWGAA